MHNTSHAVVRFPSVELGHVVHSLTATLNYSLSHLNLDAQGLDYALVSSLQHRIRLFRRVSVTCTAASPPSAPTHTFRPTRGISENSCSSVAAHMAGRGFKRIEAVPRNCCCGEYVVHAHR